MADSDVDKVVASIKTANLAFEEAFTKGQPFQRWRPPMETDSAFGIVSASAYQDQLKKGTPDLTGYDPDKIQKTGNEFYYIKAAKAAWNMYRRDVRENAGINLSYAAGVGDATGLMSNIKSMNTARELIGKSVA